MTSPALTTRAARSTIGRGADCRVVADETSPGDPSTAAPVPVDVPSAGTRRGCPRTQFQGAHARGDLLAIQQRSLRSLRSSSWSVDVLIVVVIFFEDHSD